MKSKEYAEEKEIERMNALELDRDMKIAEQKRFDQSIGGYSQQSWNNWYNHESNKERTIAAWERQREEDNNPFN